MASNINKTYVGEGKVVLIAGGGKIYTDIAARFCNSNKDLDDIIGSPYNKKIVRNIVESGHLAATEFDNYIFGIEGYSRVTEAQLIRKRLASYLVKSGRQDKDGKRTFDVALPKSVEEFMYTHELNINDLYIDPEFSVPLKRLIPSNLKGLIPRMEIMSPNDLSIYTRLSSDDILEILDGWYNEGVDRGVAEEDLRYMKPQATEFKAIVSMNAHALRDWFKIRLCLNAQREIRDLAFKMRKLVNEASPDLFEDAGPSCEVLGYCPENDRMHPNCIRAGRYYTQKDALEILKNHSSMNKSK